MVKIGSRYWDNRNKLVEEIRAGKLEVKILSVRSVCYFCNSPNRNCSRIIMRHGFREGVEFKQTYFAHENCYNEILSGFRGIPTMIN